MAPPPRIRALGVALKSARDAAGLTGQQLADAVGIDPTTLSRWETGQRTPPAREVLAILDELGVRGRERDRLVEMLDDDQSPRWATGSEFPPALADLIAHERAAERITDVAMIVPGLLQTWEYARAVMSSAGPDARDLDGRATLRIGRQEVLRRIEYTAIIDAGALTRRVGSAEAMVQQLDHLLVMSKQPNVTIRLLPGDQVHPGLEGSFMVLDTSYGRVIHVEHHAASILLDKRKHTTAYGRVLEAVSGSALQPEESVDAIRRQLARWEQPS